MATGREEDAQRHYARCVDVSDRVARTISVHGCWHPCGAFLGFTRLFHRAADHRSMVATMLQPHFLWRSIGFEESLTLVLCTELIFHGADWTMTLRPPCMFLWPKLLYCILRRCELFLLRNIAMLAALTRERGHATQQRKHGKCLCWAWYPNTTQNRSAYPRREIFSR